MLRGTGTFRPVSDVLFIQVAQGVSCEGLEADLRSGPVERELELNYHPHVILLRMMSRVQLPWHNVRDGGPARHGGDHGPQARWGLLIGHVTSNPLLAAVAVSVGLLFWLNLMSRIVLISAAWAANNIELEQYGAAADLGPAAHRAYGSSASNASGSPSPALRPKEE